MINICTNCSAEHRTKFDLCLACRRAQGTTQKSVWLEKVYMDVDRLIKGEGPVVEQERDKWK